MTKLNKSFSKLSSNYLFEEISNKKNEFIKNNPKTSIIDLGIGDITLPIVSSIIDAMNSASNELKNKDTLKGYGPSNGYLFLREKIYKNEYINFDISPDEIFISNGTKNDIANIQELFSTKCSVAICDPTYPVYVDSNIIAGRYENIFYLPCKEENNFHPEIPKKAYDLIYLCSPNNPTGIAYDKDYLSLWVEYAKRHNSIILFDGAYESFITSKNICHSIYEIKGAKEVAIEFRSFSKTAGFTSLRCSYIVIPKELKVENHKIIDLWKRRIASKFGGVPYPIQRGAEEVFSKNTKELINKNIQTYLNNAFLLKKHMISLGYKAFGGKNSPYVFCKTNNMSSWEFFDFLLENYNVISSPGSGFGKYGEGYIRLSGFAETEKIKIFINVK